MPKQWYVPASFVAVSAAVAEVSCVSSTVWPCSFSTITLSPFLFSATRFSSSQFMPFVSDTLSPAYCRFVPCTVIVFGWPTTRK